MEMRLSGLQSHLAQAAEAKAGKEPSTKAGATCSRRAKAQQGTSYPTFYERAGSHPARLGQLL